MKNTWCVAVIIVLAGLTFCCKESGLEPSARRAVGSIDQVFPEFFLEKGSDVDSSYISFRGVHRGDDTLQLEMTSWGVIEYGLLIQRQNGPRRASFILLGRCGTVPTRTWKKVTLTQFLGAIDQDTLWSLSFSNWRDSLEIGKTAIALGEK